MRGRFRESEPVAAPPHQAEFWLSAVPCCPLPASGARDSGRTPQVRLSTKTAQPRPSGTLRPLSSFSPRAGTRGLVGLWQRPLTRGF